MTLTESQQEDRTGAAGVEDEEGGDLTSRDFPMKTGREGMQSSEDELNLRLSRARRVYKIPLWLG